MGGQLSQYDADGDEEEAPQGAHTVKLVVTEILRVAGQSGYHTSVVVDDKEYFFDSVGIMIAPPMWSHLMGRQHAPEQQEDTHRTEVIEFESSHSNGKSMVEALRPYFQKGTYDIFYKNCNHFTDAALYYLTKRRLTAQYNRIERMITATNPVSTSMLNMFFRAYIENATGNDCAVDVYVPNPRAEGFQIDDVLAVLDENDEDSEVSDDNREPPTCTSTQMGWAS
eukprot:TRINITY_DN91297_c0_g1_i1.p1 TRINITY_DN91297_c0_g1~~TRINITY_DN91297_c0_g1_i1.p1  ORF type:complete len:248 (-),score=48.34 TRINITY_DN91297_c0_g1_i1:578-1252(-)